MAFERGIQTRTVDHLNQVRGWKFMTFHGTPMTEIGTPDIFGCVWGQMVVIEMKNEQGHVSKIQQYRLREWEMAGAIAFAAFSKEEAVDRLRAELRKRGLRT